MLRRFVERFKRTEELREAPTPSLSDLRDSTGFGTDIEKVDIIDVPSGAFPALSITMRETEQSYFGMENKKLFGGLFAGDYTQPEFNLRPPLDGYQLISIENIHLPYLTKSSEVGLRESQDYDQQYHRHGTADSVKRQPEERFLFFYHPYFQASIYGPSIDRISNSQFMPTMEYCDRVYEWITRWHQSFRPETGTPHELNNLYKQIDGVLADDFSIVGPAEVDFRHNMSDLPTDSWSREKKLICAIALESSDFTSIRPGLRPLINELNESLGDVSLRTSYHAGKLSLFRDDVLVHGVQRRLRQPTNNLSEGIMINFRPSTLLSQSR